MGTEVLTAIKDHSPSRQRAISRSQDLEFTSGTLKKQCLSIYSTNLYEGVKIPDLQINRFARILRAGDHQWSSSPHHQWSSSPRIRAHCGCLDAAPLSKGEGASCPILANSPLCRGILPYPRKFPPLPRCSRSSNDMLHRRSLIALIALAGLVRPP